ncbi:MAG: flagellar biosynthesis protein FliQ [Calditrichaeota bacterium]|nr:flagellar biosynthesis protein FliQ [Actinomycetota bacterium]NOY60341.1 flagellar biosynthesis protein FliQ [Calditrichota bacterium]
MSQEMVLQIINKAIITTLMVSAPLLIAGLVVGLIVAIFQAVTQIHEMTLTFIPKILAIFITLIILLPWMLGKFISFSTQIFNSIPTFSR